MKHAMIYNRYMKGTANLLSNSPMLETRVWQYCTSSLKRNEKALRLTCMEAAIVLSKQANDIFTYLKVMMTSIWRSAHKIGVKNEAAHSRQSHGSCLSFTLCKGSVNNIETVQWRTKHYLTVSTPVSLV